MTNYLLTNFEKERKVGWGKNPHPQRVEKVSLQKKIHKKFSPAFFKRRWGKGQSPYRPMRRTKFSPKIAPEGRFTVGMCKFPDTAHRAAYDFLICTYCYVLAGFSTG